MGILATLWTGDEKDLQIQGGWWDSKTIHQFYKQHRTDRHNRDYDRLFEPDRQPPEIDDDYANG